MKHYEVTFIVDPVLSGGEIKQTAQSYQDFIKNEGYQVDHVDDMGLRQLAYPINKRSSGVYYSLEFSGDQGAIIPKMELAFIRDERIMRYLTVKLDKYGVKYNNDKRNGLIGKVKTKKEKQEAAKAVASKPVPKPEAKPAPKPEAKPAAAPISSPAPQATAAAAPVVGASEEE